MVLTHDQQCHWRTQILLSLRERGDDADANSTVLCLAIRVCLVCAGGFVCELHFNCWLLQLPMCHSTTHTTNIHTRHWSCQRLAIDFRRRLCMMARNTVAPLHISVCRASHTGLPHSSIPHPTSPFLADTLVSAHRSARTMAAHDSPSPCSW